MRYGCCPRVPVAEGEPAALEGTLRPLPTLEDSLPPLLGLWPATRRKYPPGPPSKIRLFRRGEPTGLVPRGSGAVGSIHAAQDRMSHESGQSFQIDNRGLLC